MQRADAGGEDQMTKEGNDREWSSESVHYWTVIRSDWNSIVKKGGPRCKTFSNRGYLIGGANASAQCAGAGR